MSILLRTHEVTLADENLILRPMTEADWELLLKWNSDPEVLYYAESGPIETRSLGDVQGMYRAVSQTAFCFIIELDGQPIGECWLQQMNLERILRRYPGQDCRRIDLMIGERHLWGQGYGTRVIRLLTQFAFEQENAAYVFGCDVADYNLGSQRAFQKAGFEQATCIAEPPDSKARFVCDYVLSRTVYLTR